MKHLTIKNALILRSSLFFYFKTLTVNSACYLANGDYIRYLLEKLVRENSDRGGEEVEMFSVLIEIVEGAL